MTAFAQDLRPTNNKWDFVKKKKKTCTQLRKQLNEESQSGKESLSGLHLTVD